jgi:hypothetical protein
MRFSICVVAATLVGPLFPVGATMVNDPALNPVQPHVVVKAGYRSFSGAVQSISSDGRIRLRDDRNGDIKVVITDETSISKNGHKVTFRVIRARTRLHGYGNFRGGNYYAKVITID